VPELTRPNANEPRRVSSSQYATAVESDLGVSGCRLLQLPTFRDERGSLTPIEGDRDIPFEIARVFYLYDVPGGERRSGHGHRRLAQVLIAASGSFDVVVDDGRERRVVSLNRSYRGLYVPSLVWSEIENFSSGAVCLVLASDPYDEGDYIRVYEDFVEIAKQARA
jgi:dTDP-4-dehydrorhamnose 3,5-epimerase-like enzyme